jgi:hypothetical protein
MAIRLVSSLAVLVAIVCTARAAVDEPERCPGCGIALSDHGPQQFQIDILCAEVERGNLRELGLSLVPYKTNKGEFHLDDGAFRLGSESDAPAGFDVNDPLMTTFSGSVESAEQFVAHIHGLAEQGIARILASPRFVTLCGRESEVCCGGQYPYTVSVDGSRSTRYIEYGDRFEVRPTLRADGCIRLNVCCEHGVLDFANGVRIDGEVFPGVSTRRASTSVDLQPGKPLVFASLRQRTKSDASIPERLNFPSVDSGTHKTEVVEPGQMVDFVLLIEVKPVKPPVAPRPDVETPPQTPAVLLDVVPALGEQAADEDCPECRTDSEPARSGLVGLLKTIAGLASRLLPSVEIEVQATATGRCDRPCCGSSGAKLAECPQPVAILGGAVTRHDQSGPVHVPCPECVRQVQLELVESDEGMDEAECDEETVVFMEDVLHAQAQYLEEMMEARINHEREKLEIKSAAESAVAKLSARHAEELARARTEQAAELVRAKEEAWEFERKLLEAHHRQAIEHERELAQLRREHLQELHAMRLASLQSEMAMLRGSSPTKPAAANAMNESDARAPSRTGAASERPDAHGSTEIIAPRVARSIGRVWPMPDRELDALRQTDFTDSVPPVPRPIADELEELRLEVDRLRSLVEDLLCVGPGHPPAPVPQNASSTPAADSSESGIVRDRLPILR